MKYARWTLLVILILAFICMGSLATWVRGSASTQAQDPIKIGALLPFTGGLSAFGAIYYNVIQLAVVQINKAGGVLGRDLEVVFKDTGTSPSTGKTAAAQLVVYDKVPAIVGPVASVVTIPVAESVTIPGKVVLISPTATSPQITDLKDNDYVFRTVISDAFQAIVQAQLAIELGYKTMSVIYVDNSYGQGIAQAFKENFEAQGGRVLAMVPYADRLKSSYRMEVSRAIRGNPDALNVISYPGYGNVILVDAKGLGYRGKFIFSDGMRDGSVAGGPAGDYIEGAYGTAPTDFETEALDQFQADYSRRYGSTSLPCTPQVYDAVVLIALAIQAAGEATGTAIRDHLREVTNPPGLEVTHGELATALAYLRQGKDINYQGVSGPITFDEHGDVTDGAIKIWKIENGRIKTVKVTQVLQGKVGNKLPVAIFTYSPSEPVVGESITFDASDSYDPDGTITRYEWGLGDGTTATGMKVSHTFKEEGSYTVRLTITDDDGASASIEKEVKVLKSGGGGGPA